MPPAFLWNSVQVRYVGTCPETGYSLYCSLRGAYGVRVAPGGTKTLLSVGTNFTPNSKYDGKRKQFYRQFTDAFGYCKKMYVAHAVWLAAGYELTPGKQIDHINGDLSNNGIHNLRLVTPEVNQRDGGFLRILRNRGFDPTKIGIEILLRYYSRMAVVKRGLSRWRYEQLTREDIWQLLYTGDNEQLANYLYDRFGLMFDV